MGYRIRPECHSPPTRRVSGLAVLTSKLGASLGRLALFSRNVLVLLVVDASKVLMLSVRRSVANHGIVNVSISR